MQKLGSPMKKLIVCLLSLTFAWQLSANDHSENEQTAKELDNYWQEVTKTVEQGDFQGYADLFDKDAILVSDLRNNSYPIAKALAGWKQGFVDTKAGKMSAGVDFKFVKSLLGEKTAHQSGYFRYYTLETTGKKTVFIAKFEALLLKTEGKWLMTMERHQEQIDQKTWDAL